MLTDIEAVVVRVRCRYNKGRYGLSPCEDAACPTCHGKGVAVVELPWQDFIREVRDELSPAPDSQG